MLNKWNLKVAEFASREASRYTLQAIQVSKDATVATDGYRLVWVSTARQAAESFPQIDHAPRPQDDYPTFLLPTDAAKAIAAALPKKSNIPILTTAGVAVVEDGQAVIMTTDLETPQVFRPKRVSGQFPNVDVVFPKDAPVATFTVNAAYLAQLAKFAAEFTPNGPHALRVTVYGADKAIRFDAYNPDTDQGMTSLIMSIRDGGALRRTYGWVEPKDADVATVEEETTVDAAESNDAA